MTNIPINHKGNLSVDNKIGKIIPVSRKNKNAKTEASNNPLLKVNMIYFPTLIKGTVEPVIFGN